MSLFEEIDKNKTDLPKINTITTEVKKYKLNIYQIVACVTMIICFFGGIILGNLFPSCGSTSGFYNTCTTTEFNISLTIIFWFVSFLICLLFYGLGHMIYLLTSIESKIRQNKGKNK